LTGVTPGRQFLGSRFGEIPVGSIVFGRIRSSHERVEGDVMVRQHQTFGRKKLAGAAINDHDRILDAGPVRIVNIGNRDLQSALLELFDW
jgi:hypothetical protein